jgi:peptidoglycan/LPS O-acetylase OafA/YrhL
LEQCKERFEALDLLRGVAAFSVLAFHSTWPTLIGQPFPRGYLAVDMFFVLSGFVIAHAYRHRLGTVAQFRNFCVARLVRLYPLYCMARLLDAAILLFFSFTATDWTIDRSAIFTSLAAAIFFMPVPPSWSVNPLLLFPLLDNAWSLFWELAVNLLYASVALRLRGALLGGVVIVSALAAALALAFYGSINVGWGWDTFFWGAPRALFSFFAGVAIFRLRGLMRAPAVPSLLVAAALMLSFAPGDWAGAPYDAFCVYLLYPLIVWLGADAVQGARVRSFGTLAGYLSYPVYLMQVPIRLAVAPLQVRAARLFPSGGTIELLLYLAATLLGSWAMARWFDTPVRRWLRAKLSVRTPEPAAQTAP